MRGKQSPTDLRLGAPRCWALWKLLRAESVKPETPPLRSCAVSGAARMAVPRCADGRPQS